MPRHSLLLAPAFLGALCLTGRPSKGLKDYYKDYFPVGVAVSVRNITGPDTTLILQQFNSLTPENAMKMGPIHPEEGRYNWKDADAIVDFATAHGLRIRGHNLCWHEQTPPWLFKDAQGNDVSKEVLLQRLKDHITTVVSRYKGRIYAWDVVNEAVADNGGPDNTQILRNSPWYRICGDEFIAKAFEYAHAADPQAQLFYNDYNTERPEKRQRVYRLLKQLVDAGVPITGVGIQAHWSIFEPSPDDLRATIDLFSGLGLKVQITELDISVYPWEKERRALRPVNRTPIPRNYSNSRPISTKKSFRSSGNTMARSLASRSGTSPTNTPGSTITPSAAERTTPCCSIPPASRRRPTGKW
jgi:endo-1,4-beta-xylanase